MQVGEAQGMTQRPMKLIQGGRTDVVDGCMVIDEIIALIDRRLPDVTQDDPCLTPLRQFRTALLAGQLSRAHRPSGPRPTQ